MSSWSAPGAEPAGERALAPVAAVEEQQALAVGVGERDVPVGQWGHPRRPVGRVGGRCDGRVEPRQRLERQRAVVAQLQSRILEVEPAALAIQQPEVGAVHRRHSSIPSHESVQCLPASGSSASSSCWSTVSKNASTGTNASKPVVLAPST